MSAEPQGSLKKRTVKAGGWQLFQVVLGNLMRLGSNLIMTRLLVPEAFGLMSFVMTIVTAFTLLSDIGIQRSVIRDADGNTTHYLRAAWVLQIYRGSLIAAGIFLTAVLTGLFAPHYAPEGTVYADPQLPFLLAAITLVPFLDALKSTNQFLASRLFHNGRSAAVQIAGQFSALVVQVSIAYFWPSVWSLIIGTTLGQLVKTLISHLVFQGPRMAWKPNQEISNRIWNFGKFLMASSTLTFAATNADKFILASFLESAEFGLYAIALVWISAGQTLLNRLSQGVGFAAIGEVLRVRPNDAPSLFKRFQRVFDGLCILAFIAMFFFGEPFINLLYTGSYQTAGHYLTLLSLGFLTLRFDSMNMLILNHGNSRAMMVVSGIRAVVVVSLLPAAFAVAEVPGALLAVALTPLSSAPYTIWLIRPLLGEGYAARQVLWVVAILLTAVAVYLTY
ncbi:Membrane protein involved in the export of O-antigen and teichoic acid [Pseudooceanicola nitratireducens]|jgi:O-antigen/teichoic acid export membrane protein|uniref:Membrane protein involved in the export of O-antigen and teichoic acid n=1 Tax=Pseudooceanicola nitratireducens TaxID=517719 RepID=A0A1I1R1J9_9RHOB|nr:oligosaccharide flippase family protein [Pseudooceanicola nitratireducens]SEJ77817.1 Membrane protein involved in the export of O-antigen and teichoic acid [Pseudooceanicola nitratireducens]SFD28185.1 Membrane protein involved in the export of O-antigen and teichoic acid [Pseudooceanicola nitratireducens]